VITLAASTLACSVNLGGPDIPSVPQPSTASATQASESWSDALNGAATSGEVKVILTEDQLTSALAERLADDNQALLRSPAVTLRDGAIQIYGVIQQGPFEANVRLVVTPTVDAEGRLNFELTSADFGPIPAPNGLRESLSGMLSEALVGPLGALATGFRVTSVAVADGSLAIVAELR
jgi:hypothetical protein